LGDASDAWKTPWPRPSTPLIAAGLDAEHRRTLAYARRRDGRGASRHWIATSHEPGFVTPDAAASDAEAHRLAGRLADLAWAGLRSVHAD